MELAERLALRDILASACSMAPFNGENPGLRSDNHLFHFFPDRIVQVESGGRFVKAIDYADSGSNSLSAFVQATGTKTLSFAELLERNLLQQISQLFKLEEGRRQQEAERLNRSDDDLRVLVLDDD